MDLVAIVRTSPLEAALQREALVREADRRRLMLPMEFAVPDLDLWEKGYRAEAARAVGLSALSLTDAMASVKPFGDALLAGTAAGSWDPDASRWTPT